jgi:hypothetical protein
MYCQTTGCLCEGVHGIVLDMADVPIACPYTNTSWIVECA